MQGTKEEQHRFKWLDELRATIPYGTLADIEQKTELSVPFRKFLGELRKNFHAAFVGAQFPSESTCRILYERMLWARQQIQWVEALRNQSNKATWKDYVEWLDESLSASRKLRSVLSARTRKMRVTRALQECVDRGIHASIRLERCLASAIREARQVKGIASIRNRNWLLRSSRKRMDARLRKECPGLTLQQRIELIRLSTEIAGLKECETVDAIARALSPSRQRESRKA